MSHYLSNYLSVERKVNIFEKHQIDTQKHKTHENTFVMSYKKGILYVIEKIERM